MEDLRWPADDGATYRSNMSLQPEVDKYGMSRLPGRLSSQAWAWRMMDIKSCGERTRSSLHKQSKQAWDNLYLRLDLQIAVFHTHEARAEISQLVG